MKNGIIACGGGPYPIYLHGQANAISDPTYLPFEYNPALPYPALPCPAPSDPTRLDLPGPGRGSAERSAARLRESGPRARPGSVPSSVKAAIQAD